MRILFVCLGNICRSPAAEAILREILLREELSSLVTVDSAGTTGYHLGEEPDPRMRRALESRGYTQWSRARLVEIQDFQNFDLIIPMDQQNLRDLRLMAPNPPSFSKLRLACTFAPEQDKTEVPDPYYGTKNDFELVVTLLEDVARGILLDLHKSQAIV